MLNTDIKTALITVLGTVPGTALRMSYPSLVSATLSEPK